LARREKMMMSPARAIGRRRAYSIHSADQNHPYFCYSLCSHFRQQQLPILCYNIFLQTIMKRSIAWVTLLHLALRKNAAVEAWSSSSPLIFFGGQDVSKPVKNRLSRSRQHHRHTRLLVSMIAESNADGSDNNDRDNGRLIEIESLSPSQIIELLELSFRPACIALAKGDDSPLQLFIVAALQALKHQNQETSSRTSNAPSTSSTVIQAVEALPPPPSSTTQPSYPLDDSEIQLRTTWIQAIALMMEHHSTTATTSKKKTRKSSKSASSKSNDDDAVLQTYGPVLDDLVDIFKSGLGLNVRQFVANRKEMLLEATDEKESADGESTTTTTAKNNNPLLLIQDEDDDDDEPKIPTSLESSVELAVVTQTVRVLYSTLAVLMEEDNQVNNNNNSNGDGGTGTTSRGFG
jgi:hypothetical protein